MMIKSRLTSANGNSNMDQTNLSYFASAKRLIQVSTLRTLKETLVPSISIKSQTQEVE